MEPSGTNVKNAVLRQRPERTEKQKQRNKQENKERQAVTQEERDYREFKRAAIRRDREREVNRQIVNAVIAGAIVLLSIVYIIAYL